MKKNKKKKNAKRSNIPYTHNRNYFGDVAETHLIVLERETARSQMIEAIKQLNRPNAIEFTFDMSCFLGHDDELEQFMSEMNLMLQLRETLNAYKSRNYFTA